MRKKIIWISLGSIIGVIVLIASLGIYKFNVLQDDIYYSGEGIQPESHKVFVGSWINPSNNMGFILAPDSSAHSINAATLVYKKWKIENDCLVLTALSLGNHQLSVDDEVYPIVSFNSKRIYLKHNGEDIYYEKVKNKTIKEKLPNITFDYCPVEIDTITYEKSAIDFESNSRAEQFKTVISDSYTKGETNFAQYYHLVTWGCGTGVQEGVIIDTRDGKVYDLPTQKGFKDIGSGCESQKNSILLITYNAINNPNTKEMELDKTFWLWNEKSKDFVLYK